MIFSIHKFILFIFFIIGFLSPVSSISAKGVYQTEEDFLSEVFDGNVPKSKALLLRSKIRKPIEKILEHPYSGLRIKYWQNTSKSAWILEEIGKEYPITFGMVVSGGEIIKAKVLIFREIRGWEIKYPAFTRQFIGASFDGKELSQNIDGISGATLSFWAMTKIAKIALFLDQYIKNK